MLLGELTLLPNSKGSYFVLKALSLFLVALTSRCRTCSWIVLSSDFWLFCGSHISSFHCNLPAVVLCSVSGHDSAVKMPLSFFLLCIRVQKVLVDKPNVICDATKRTTLLCLAVAQTNENYLIWRNCWTDITDDEWDVRLVERTNKQTSSLGHILSAKGSVLASLDMHWVLCISRYLCLKSCHDQHLLSITMDKDDANVSPQDALKRIQVSNKLLFAYPFTLLYAETVVEHCCSCLHARGTELGIVTIV